MEGLDGHTGLVQESTDLLAELDGLKGLIASGGPVGQGVGQESTNIQTALEGLAGIVPESPNKIPIASDGPDSRGTVQESTNIQTASDGPDSRGAVQESTDIQSALDGLEGLGLGQESTNIQTALEGLEGSGLVPESLHRAASDGPEVHGVVQDSTKARIGSDDGPDGLGIVQESTESENPLKQISFDDIEVRFFRICALYGVGRPIIRKVLKMRIWIVPPVCLGSRKLQ